MVCSESKRGKMSRYVAHEDDFDIEELVGRSYKLIVGSNKLPCDAITGVVSFFPPHAHAPGHIHDVAEEVIYCLEGQGEIAVDGKLEPIHPGSFIVIPPRLLHSINNTSDKTIKLLCLFSPKIQVGRYPNISSD